MDLAKKYFYVITGLLVFIIYIITAAPSVVQIDSGELAAVQATLGIAHPTGYPLFTMIGYLFSLIPLPFSTIFQLNLLAAIYCSVGIAIFVYTVKLVLDDLGSFSSKKIKMDKAKKRKKTEKKGSKKNDDTALLLSESIKLIAAIGGGLILAFSEVYWLQSTSVEVYSLHILLINLIFLFLIRGYLAPKDDKKKIEIKFWILFSLFLAFGFSNHMTTLLIIPGVAFLFFNKYKFTGASSKKISIMLVVFLPVLFLMYLYLPIRAAQEPVINWGNPVDLERIFRHITGEQYQVWLFASTAAAKKQLIQFVENLPGQFSISLILSVIGIISSFTYARKLFWFLLITFLFTVFYSINYEIHDIDTYFLLAHISLSFFAVFGLLTLLKLSKKNSAIITITITLVFITIQFISNFSKANQSNIYTYEDYTYSILNSVSKESVIFSYQWDYFISAAYYIQFAEGYREDIAIVDKELLRRSWYFDQLNRNYPNLFNNMTKDVIRFREALVPFERGGNFNANLLERLYRKLMTDLVIKNVTERGYYIAPEIYEQEMQKGEFVLPEGYYLIPDLLLFKVVQGNEYIHAADPDFEIRISEKRNYYINKIEYFVGSMLARRAMYELQYNKPKRAKVYIKKIRNDLPNYTLPKMLQNIPIEN
ncbi:MAG: DUF2723 domain-containing protein [Ignavibacterium sp.]|nr:MAG: DUF2723 domain-containing protein [Ignavibacterium sp.]